MKRLFLSILASLAIASLSACGGGSEETYDGRFTFNGVTYHCTNSEAGNLCQKNQNCSKCDKV